jgi:hypothetical protein
METPLQIDLQGIDARPNIRAEIDKHVAQLEERWGRITAGRVVVKAPSGHHRTGGLYEITIHLAGCCLGCFGWRGRAGPG